MIYLMYLTTNVSIILIVFIIFVFFFFFFFNDTATTEIYTLSLHDALPISPRWPPRAGRPTNRSLPPPADGVARGDRPDRKSTRLNSSHVEISYAVFCMKKKKQKKKVLKYTYLIYYYYIH